MSSHKATDVPRKYTVHDKPRVTTNCVENNSKAEQLFCILFTSKLIR